MRLILQIAALLAGFTFVTNATAASEHPVRGGILRVAQRAELKTFNPVIAFDAPSREVLGRLSGDLLTIDRVTQQVTPGLAESWISSSGGTRYTLKLRPGLRFSDGAACTVDDVIFSWAVYLDEAVHAPQRDLLLIDGKPIRALRVDERTVEFLLPKPYAAAERLFDSIAILPRHKLEAAWKAGRLREAWSVGSDVSEIVGMGPFRLKQYRPGEATLVERNPYFWKQGQPYLDGIEFHLLVDEEVQLARFVSGDLDILNRVGARPASYLASQGKAVTDLGPGLEYNVLCFNLSPGNQKAGTFGQREFRAALSLATDREAIVNLVYGGHAAPLWGHVSPGNRIWYSNTIPHPPQSIEGARKQLAAAGFRLDTGGHLLDPATRKPLEFSILVSASSPERMQMATILAADWAKLGIAVTIAPLEFRSLLDRAMKTRQFDTVLLGLGGGDADPNPEMNVWLSSGGMHVWNPDQKQPATEWEAKLDSLMRMQMFTIEPDVRKRLYRQVQQIAADQVPMIFLASPNVVVAQRGNTGNFRPAVLHHFTLWNADELYLRQSHAKSR